MIFSTSMTQFRKRLPYPGMPASIDMPWLSVVVESAGRSMPGRFPIDSGADSVVFPLDVAQSLGIDLTTAPTSHVTTAGGNRVVVRYAEVTIQVVHHQTRCRWKTWAGFAPVKRWLFGNLGGLEHFHFILDIGAQEFILVPRESLPVVA